MSAPVTIATASMHVIHEREANLAKYMDFMEQAEAAGADLLVLPEQSLQGYMFGIAHEITSEEYEYHHENAEAIDGPSTTLIAEAAEARHLTVIFGMTEKTPVGVICNSSVVVSAGKVIGLYRKTHAPGDEAHLYRHGSVYPVFETPVGRIGISICYDMAFPEVARCLALNGADILVMPTAWPRCSNYEEAPDDRSVAPLGEVHDVLCRARAIENQRWYVSSNQVGRDDRSILEYYGHSGIVDPTGQWISQTGYEEGLATATVDIQAGRVDAITGWFDLIRDRRPETYGAVSDRRIYEPEVLEELGRAATLSERV
jgi:predicted amidohydrolase